MKVRLIVLWLSILTLACTPVLHAAPDQQTDYPPPTGKGENAAGGAKGGAPEMAPLPSQELIKQKLQLVKMLLAKSPALERVAHSDDATAKQLLAAANTHFTNADEALNAGNSARANELLDESLRLIENISRQAPDPLQIESEQRTRYSKLLEGVRSIQYTYQDLRHRLAPKDSVSPSTVADLERVRSLVSQAQTLTNNDHYREAGDLLKIAHAIVVAALNKLPASTTVPYELKFDSAAEEFDHEVARYRSYEELAPIAYVELKPGEASINLSERYVRESRTTLAVAQQQAAGGDYSTAIITLQGAIKQLQTALQTVGVIVPE